MRFTCATMARSSFPSPGPTSAAVPSSSASTSDQASQLLADLAQCDGILIFCDADAAARGRSVTNQIGRISNLVGQAINRLDRVVPLGLVFTKADLVEELDDRIVQSINGLVEAVAASKHVVGTVIPVACGPTEMNVPAPVLFALYFGVLLKHNALVEQLNAQVALAQQHEAKANEWLGLPDLWRSFNGETTYKERAGWAFGQAQAKLAEVQPLLEPIKGLQAYLEELPTF